MVQSDLTQLLSGKEPSQEFLKKNKRELNNFMKGISQEKLMGYMEYSNQNQLVMEFADEEDKIDEPTVVSKSKESKEKPEKRKNKVLEAYGVTPKVMETWLNETLDDAQHLDIPGVILQPEHKNPVSRYGIDRIELTNSNIPNEMVDRIYRSLFVYSVGFYEMLSKILQHSNQKYTLITRVWKVFAVILEYCCYTDYQMMITNITKTHEEEV